MKSMPGEETPGPALAGLLLQLVSFTARAALAPLLGRWRS